jgi:hypothetical protein
VRNVAMPMAIGTAINNANTELSTVTWKRPATPNFRLFASVVLNSELVKKLTLFTCIDGTARISRNRPIKAIAPMIVAPAAIATALKTLSPQRPPPAFNPPPLLGSGGIFKLSPIGCGLVTPDEPTAVGSGLIVIAF